MLRPKDLKSAGVLSSLGRSSHVVSLASQAVSAVFGMVVFVLYARWLGPSKMGSLVLFITTFTILDMLRSGFIQSAFVKFFNQTSGERQQRVAASSFVLAGLWSLSWSALIWLSGLFVADLFPSTEATLYFHIFPLLHLVSFPGQWFLWFAQAQSRFDRILVFRVTASLVTLTGLILLRAAGQLDAVGAAWVLLGSALASSVVAGCAGWIRPVVRQFDWTRVMDMVRFGRFSVFTLLGTSLLKSADTYLIGALWKIEAVAIYAVAQKVLELLDLPIRALSASLYPVLARCADSEGRLRLARAMERATSGLILMLLMPAATIFVLAPHLVTWIGGADFLAAVPVVRVFVVAALLAPLDRIQGMALDGIGRPETNMVKVFVMLFLNIVGDVLVLMFWPNLWAVSMVTVITFMVGIVFGYYQLKGDVLLSARRTWHYLHMWIQPAYVRIHLRKSSFRSIGKVSG